MLVPKPHKNEGKWIAISATKSALNEPAEKN